MAPRLKVSRSGIELIKSFEGFRPGSARLPDGRWTIGYGHTLSAREGASVSEADAEALLLFDLMPVTEAVSNLVFTPLNPNQFDALVAFAFNVGVDEFRRSDVLKRVNEGRLTEAACALDLWRKADIAGETVVLDALIRRRAAEKALFLTPVEGFVPTPSALVRPAVDDALAPALPRRRPAEIEAPMEGEVATVRRVGPVDAEPEPEPAPQSAEAAPVMPETSPSAGDGVGFSAAQVRAVEHLLAGGLAPAPVPAPVFDDEPAAAETAVQPAPVEETDADAEIAELEAKVRQLIGLTAPEAPPAAPEPVAAAPQPEPAAPVLAEPIPEPAPISEPEPEPAQAAAPEPEPQPVAQPEPPRPDTPPDPPRSAFAPTPPAPSPAPVAAAAMMARLYSPYGMGFSAIPPRPRQRLASVEGVPVDPQSAPVPAPEPAPTPAPAPESVAPQPRAPEPVRAFEAPASGPAITHDEPATVAGVFGRAPGPQVVPGPVAAAPVAHAVEPLVLTPPPEVEEERYSAPAFGGVVHPATASVEVDEQEPPLFDSGWSETTARARVVRYEATENEARSAHQPNGPFVLLGAIGFVAFGGSVAAFLKAQDAPASGASPIDNPAILAWILAFVGAACVGTAVYFLLKRLGGVED